MRYTFVQFRSVANKKENRAIIMLNLVYLQAKCRFYALFCTFLVLFGHNTKPKSIKFNFMRSEKIKNKYQKSE